MKSLATLMPVFLLLVSIFSGESFSDITLTTEKGFGKNPSTSFTVKPSTEFLISSFFSIEVGLPVTFSFDFMNMMNSMASTLGNSLMNEVDEKQRGKREIVDGVWRNHTLDNVFVGFWNEHASHFSPLLLPLLEIMDSLGFNGKSCLLRTVCELNEEDTVGSYGNFGEAAIVWLRMNLSSLEKSPFLQEIFKAQRIGKRKGCGKYHAKCGSSIFY